MKQQKDKTLDDGQVKPFRPKCVAVKFNRPFYSRPLNDARRGIKTFFRSHYSRGGAAITTRE